MFTGLPAVLGPLSIADPSAGNSSLTVEVSDSSGTLSDTAAGAGTVSGSGSNQLTLTGDLADINTMLVSLIYAAASAGSDTVDVQVADVANHVASQNINVTIETVPLTAAVINAPSSAMLIDGVPTAVGGISISDPYAQTTGEVGSLQITSSNVTSFLSGPLGATITGQGTNNLIITGTVGQINAYFMDAWKPSWEGALAAGIIGLMGTAIIELSGLTVAVLNTNAPEAVQIVLEAQEEIQEKIFEIAEQAGEAYKKGSEVQELRNPPSRKRLRLKLEMRTYSHSATFHTISMRLVSLCYLNQPRRAIRSKSRFALNLGKIVHREAPSLKSLHRSEVTG